MALLVLVALALLTSCSVTEDRTVPPLTSPQEEPPTRATTEEPLGTATPLPSPTTVPPHDLKGVEATIAAGEMAISERTVDPLCSRLEDTDGDEKPEWVVLFLRSVEPRRLAASVLDGQSWHPLRPVESERYGLGEHPACEVEVGDLTADGDVEIAVWGHAEGTVDLLHIFAWDGAGYEEVASFEADAGLRWENADGVPGEEVIVGHNAGNGLAWETVHAWDGRDYAWVWERYRWLFADHPHAYLTDSPEHTVISFYLALGDRDLPGAYNLLWSETRGSRPYREWATGYDTTLRVEVGSVHETLRAGDTATVTAQVRSFDNLDGYIIGRLWDVTWRVVRYEGEWRLDNATANRLSEWEAPYFGH